MRNKWFLVVAALAAIAVFAAFRLGRKSSAEYFTARVERGDIRELVEATGTINAVTTVQVGSQVSGTLARLNADFNSRVKKGQVIAQIEPSIFQGVLLQAQADWENARANLAAARANLERSKAAAVQARAEYGRTQQLATEGVMSQQQLEIARANSESAEAAVSASQAQVTQAAAQVSQRAAAVKVAQINLGHTTIEAPVDGVVVSRNVDVGQTVAASLQAPTLFTIAQDLTKMQVYAKTDESDVGQIQVGQRATFKVDAFPRDSFEGRVVQVRMNATVVQNVVTYDTVIEFSNPDMKLFPGMTAYVTIPVASASNVLKVPNGALRFKPDMKPEEVRALLLRYGIEESGGEGRRGRRAQQDRSQQAARPPQEGDQPGGGAAEGPAEPRPDVVTVWKLRPDKTIAPVKLRVGITDRTVTQLVEVLKGELKEGDQLVTGATRAAAAPRSPMQGGGGQRR
ncbi:MAG: efflux RND transporter periplasmic adaptor subunit [Terriglobales bacterium]